MLVGVPGTGLSLQPRGSSAAAPTKKALRTSCAPLVKSFCDGTNGCLLAYGLPGSGKRTRYSGPGLRRPRAARRVPSRLENAGVVPRALADCLKAVEGARRGACVNATLSFTYLELYREQLTDLTGERSLYTSRQGRGGDGRRDQAGCDDGVLWECGAPA